MSIVGSVSPHVLMTPLDIIATARQLFPDAEIKEVVSEDRITPEVELILSASILPVRISTGVMRKKFVEEIDLLRVLIKADRICSPNTVWSHVLNTAPFSIQTPLRDWTEFRRKMYEASGTKCIDVIIDFLRVDSTQPSSSSSGSSSFSTQLEELSMPDDKQLRQLGLHPEQVDDEPTDSDLTYFRGILKLEDSLIEACKVKYPKIFAKIMSISFPEKYAEIRKKLEASVVGQEYAVDKLSLVLADQLVEKEGENKFERNYTFLFVGPSGVGKTALALAVSKIKDGRFIRLDMSLYSDRYRSSSLFGSYIGFIGSTDKSHFAKKLDQLKPTCIVDSEDHQEYQIEDSVILFDECEKAHPEVKQLLLTLCDDECYSASHCDEATRKIVSTQYKFKNCIFIFTSQLFEREILEAFTNGGMETQIVRDFIRWNRTTSGELRSLSTEWLNRIKVIPFRPISRGECFQSVIKRFMDHTLKELQRYSFHEFVIENEKLFFNIIENNLYEEGIGADIRRIVGYFSDFRLQIGRQHSSWGDSTTIKIIFFVDQDKVCFCPHRFGYPVCPPISIDF